MRPAVRMALASLATLAVTLPVTGSALAATGGHPAYPSQAQVDKARRDVVSKKASVQQIQASLSAAQARMEAASNAAESAAEKYNGARWELSVAQKATRQAQAASAAAAADVERQRAGIVQLVTESYQNGTALNTATALMGGEGPQGLMNRYGVVQSAGDSMQARYDAFTLASAKAKAAAGKAKVAQAKQADLAAEAKKLATAAGQAAAAAGVAASEIASQKEKLVQALATAEHISVSLASQRQKALERIAAEKKAAEERAAAIKAAKAAKKAAEEAKRNRDGNGDGGPQGAPPAPGGGVTPVPNPAPNQSVAVQRAIAYAKAQLGKPYQWGAAGPGTFDCSGLTMQAWARGGKSLPHYSVAQFEQSTPISINDAQPGDLLFWSNNGSPSGIHHVALYLGGGQFIEAPHTGADVRYNSIYNWYPDFVARP